MDTVIAAIQKTPIPTILILGGLLYILLGFVNKLGGFIEVSTEHKRLAIPIGMLVLIIGLFFTIFSPPITIQEPDQKQPKPPPEPVLKPDISAIAAPDTKQKAQQKYMRVRALDEVNVRNGPAPYYDIVRKINNGDFLPVQRTENGWSYIGDGWVNSKFLYDPDIEGE